MYLRHVTFENYWTFVNKLFTTGMSSINIHILTSKKYTTRQ